MARSGFSDCKTRVVNILYVLNLPSEADSQASESESPAYLLSFHILQLIKLLESPVLKAQAEGGKQTTGFVLSQSSLSLSALRVGVFFEEFTFPMLQTCFDHGENLELFFSINPPCSSSHLRTPASKSFALIAQYCTEHNALITAATWMKKEFS